MAVNAGQISRRAADCLLGDVWEAAEVDADEEEQPHDVDEMPIPGGGFEAEVTLRGELTTRGARNQHTIRKMVPTMTWKPWKPVARKNTDE